jgi:hypothetical protein
MAPAAAIRPPALPKPKPVLPPGLQRTRHYGLLANRTRQDKLRRFRELLVVDRHGTRASCCNTG